MKTKTLKIRTNAAAKARTVGTLTKHDIALSTAFARLMGGQGLVAKEDADYISDCTSMMTKIRQLRLRPSYHIGRGAGRVWMDAKNKAISDLYTVISALSVGTQPRYDSFVLSRQNIADGLDGMYSIRADIDTIPSISGKRDLSAAVRDKLDWILDVPSAVTTSHVMALTNLTDAVISIADILDRGYVTSGSGNDLSLNDAAVQQLAEHLTSLSATLAATAELKSDRL